MKINAALVGSGNIGTDLMMKALRSDWINPVWMVGIDPDSDGLAKAGASGLKTTHEGVDALLDHIEADDIRIAFDATSAYVTRRTPGSWSSGSPGHRPDAGCHRPLIACRRSTCRNMSANRRPT